MIYKFILKTFHSATKVIRRLRKSGVKRNQIILWLDVVYCRLVLGYDFDDYCTYEFWLKSRNQRREYLSFRENTRLALRNTPRNVYDLFLDKAKWNERFYKFVYRDWVATKGLDRESLISFIKKNGEVILKPLSDFGGVGIKKISCKQENLDELIDFILLQEKNMMLEECIYNHPLLKELAPSSLNTIRIVSVIDNNGKVHIPAALLRMGSGMSLTDNYHSGGMVCPINLSTGKLEKTASGEFNIQYEVHPFSKIRFEGYEIPRFNEVP